MLNEGGVPAYNPVSLDGNMPPSLPPQDPSREHAITDSVSVALHPADAPNALQHPVSAPRPDARADAPADPAPPDASDTPASPVPPPPPPAGYAPGVLARPISAVVKRFVVPHRSRPVRLVMPRLRRTPYRRMRPLSNRVLRAWFKITSRLPRCFVIVIMTSVFEAFQRRQKTPISTVGTVRQRLLANTSSLAVPLPTGAMFLSTSMPPSPTLTYIAVPASFFLYAFYPKTRFFSRCSPLVLLRRFGTPVSGGPGERGGHHF